MKKIKRALSLVLVFCMLCTMTVTGFAADTTSGGQTNFMKVVHLDAGRKYFSVDSIEKIIDNASADGYNYLELGVGNDGLRFLLDDMSVTANDTTYASDEVKSGIQQGNKNYDNENRYRTNTDELTQSEMDKIISYAKSKGISIIPLINSPGHMDAILSAANSLTDTNCSYNGSKRTIDVTNKTAVAFTQALIQKYVNYFAGKGCKYFNMGADEYANDVYTGGSMGFGNLQNTGKYSYFVKYVNQMAAMIKNAGMTPMAFNDGIYYNNVTSDDTFDTGILVSYWSSGWSGYTPASASFLASQRFKLLNTHGSYYWVLGKSDAQCSAEKASGFNAKSFPYKNSSSEGTVSDDHIAGAMFCIWCDYPGADTEANVVSQTADTMAAFAETLPSTSNSGTTTPNKAPAAPTSKTITVPVGGTVTETVSGNYSDVTTANKNIATVTAKYTKTDASSISYNASASVSTGKGYTDGYTEGDTTYPSKNIIDNNANTFCWYPDAQTVGTYMQVDLGAAIPFGAVRLTTPSDARDDVCTNAAVKVSADRSTWETIGSYTGEEGKSQIFTNTVDTVRYIRVELTTAKNTWWKLAEIEWGNVDASNNFTRMAASGTVTQEASEQTTLTFTGVAAGTTTVQVGDATYTVHVVDKAPAANTIRLEYWITNSKVYSQNNTNSAYYKEITTNTNGVRTETGVDVSTLAPEHAYSEFGGWKDVYYWQTMRLDANNKQTNDSGDDETADGTTLTHIRYWNNAWQYQTSDGTWNSFESGDQLVAYYLQKTDVTKEITTYAKDWGYATSGTTPDTSDKEGQVALTVAVVYPDGTVSPAESDMYSKSTTIFNYWDNRDIGIVAPINNSDYDISKITVTDGKRDKNTNPNPNIWYSNDSITWKKTTNDAGSKWYDEKTVWDETTNAGTTPMVNGKTSNITWSAKNTAKLVLIYLKPVQKETNLNVVYWDDNENKAINANPFQIAMKYNQGDEQPSFVTSLRQSSEVKTGTFTLDDDAYVTNSSGVNQTFNKDLSIVQGRHTDEIDPKYGSGLYEYASADISEDGKKLTLHYNLKPNALTKNYVVDFGKSVDVPITDLINKTESVTKVEVSPNAKVNADNSITYTPSKILTGTDFVKVTVTYSTGSTQPFTIGFTPASNVMYEESFVKPEGTEWKTTEDAENDTQAKEVLGEEDIHGYDESYDTDSEFSNGSAYQAQLTIPSGKDFTETKKATFTFTGTGFDVISECGTNTGVLLAVVKDTDGKTVKSYLVDTYFTGDEKGIISGTDITDILDYQVPVVRCMGLTQATYTVDVYGYLTNGSGAVKNAAKSAEATTAEGEVSEETVAEVLDDMSVKGVEASKVEATCMDDNSVLLGGTGVEETAAKSRTARAAVATTSANVYIDGVRVYNTLNENNGANKYTKSEQNVKYESVYDYVKNSLDANGSWTEKAMIYTEYDGSTDISSIAEYKQQGPENEVYLAPGCDIAFALKNYKEGETVQIAMKAVNDSVTVDSDGQCDTDLLESATEMYYKLTPTYDEELDAYVVKIGNDKESDGVLSLSNLKLSSDVTVSSNQALADKIIEEDNTKPAFTPKTFTVSVPADTLKVGRSSVIKVKASTDVKHVCMTVNGGKPIELNANNRNAVANGKTDLYSYSKTIKTKGTGALSEGTYEYSIYAVDEAGNHSKSVDFTVTIAK